MHLINFMHADNYTTFHAIIKKVLKAYMKNFKM